MGVLGFSFKTLKLNLTVKLGIPAQKANTAMHSLAWIAWTHLVTILWKRRALETMPRYAALSGYYASKLFYKSKRNGAG